MGSKREIRVDGLEEGGIITISLHISTIYERLNACYYARYVYTHDHKMAGAVWRPHDHACLW